MEADEAIRMHDLPLARRMYESAYSKIEDLNISQTNIWEEWLGLVARIVSNLIVVVLELHDHEAVHRWADLSIDQLLTDAEYYGDEIGYITYYGKAATFKKQGKISAAIRNFEWALNYDGGCHATYYQIESLKQVETEEDRLRDTMEYEVEVERRDEEQREASMREYEKEKAQERVWRWREAEEEERYWEWRGAEEEEAEEAEAEEAETENDLDREDS